MGVVTLNNENWNNVGSPFVQEIMRPTAFIGVHWECMQILIHLEIYCQLIDERIILIWQTTLYMVAGMGSRCPPKLLPHSQPRETWIRQLDKIRIFSFSSSIPASINVCLNCERTLDLWTLIWDEFITLILGSGDQNRNVYGRENQKTFLKQ